MAKIISCPSCARKLSIAEEAPAVQLFKCPACADVFEAPPDERIEPTATVSRQPLDSTRGGDFSERPLQPLLPPVPHDERQPEEAEWDDDWPDIRRPAKKMRRKSLFGGGVLALVILAVCAWLFFDKSDPSLIGSWKGTQQFPHAGKIEVTYHFRPDGTMIDEHVDGGMLVRAVGRYTFSRGEVHIQWARGGGFERARVRRVGLNTVEYVIVAHSDQWQIGGKATFTRVGR